MAINTGSEYQSDLDASANFSAEYSDRSEYSFTHHVQILNLNHGLEILGTLTCRAFRFTIADRAKNLGLENGGTDLTALNQAAELHCEERPFCMSLTQPAGQNTLA